MYLWVRSARCINRNAGIFYDCRTRKFSYFFHTFCRWQRGMQPLLKPGAAKNINGGRPRSLQQRSPLQLPLREASTLPCPRWALEATTTTAVITAAAAAAAAVAPLPTRVSIAALRPTAAVTVAIVPPPPLLPPPQLQLWQPLQGWNCRRLAAGEA